MAILVTGGAGYIGSHTSIELIKEGYDVIILDNFYNSKPEALNRIKKISGGDFKFYECDIRDKAGLDKVFAENEIEAVIHFAGLKAVGESCRKPLEYYENNIGGTVTLCEAMRDAGCKKLFSAPLLQFTAATTLHRCVRICPQAARPTPTALPSFILKPCFPTFTSPTMSGA